MTVREVDLGSAPAGSRLVFKVSKSTGFVANALLDCEMKVVAAWEAIELAGRKIDEELLPKGFYTLQITVAFFSKAAVTADLEFGVLSAGPTLPPQSLSFKGKKGDLSRVLTVVNIV